MVDPDSSRGLLPNAKGIFESQTEFDDSLDWDRLFRRNPMRHFCDGEHEARITLMNFRRAMESLRRAWDFFQASKERHYQRVIVTRPDLKFIQEFEPPLSGGLRRHLWIPRFGSCGGLNDRFAAGNEESAAVYCQRADFAHEWLLSGEEGNPETLLKRWLQQQDICWNLVDFPFQRVRANGEIAAKDSKLKPLIKERFLILGRKASQATRRLEKVFATLGKVETIVDQPGDEGIWYDDNQVKGYGGLTSHSSHSPPVTAWSRAMYHLAKNLRADEAVWFVEDEVAGSTEFFRALVRRTAASGADLASFDIRSRRNDASWPDWDHAEPWFPEPWRSFGSLSRKSARLVRAALEFREKNGHFACHEILFPSIAMNQGMRCFDWNVSMQRNRLFGSLSLQLSGNSSPGAICYPVKDAADHEAICNWEGLPAPVASSEEFPCFHLARCSGHSISVEDYIVLGRYCRHLGIRNVVEFGPGDSTLAFLDAGCRIVSFESDGNWLDQCLVRFGTETRAEIRFCAAESTPESLPFAPDLVFVDGPSRCDSHAVPRLALCEWGLAICGHVILHDSRREEEGRILEELAGRGMRVEQIPTRKGMASIVNPQKRPTMPTAEFVFGDASRYQLRDEDQWFAKDLPAWQKPFKSSQAVRALDIGCGEGRRANLLLELLFPAEGSEVHCVEDFETLPGGDAIRADFERNAETSGNAGRLHLYEGTTTEVLAWMIASKDAWESFDFIQLGRGRPAHEQLTAACQAWCLLRRGGVLVFGERGAAYAGFETGFRRLAERLFEGTSVVLRKR
ncbi:hypothetical protein [Haloferula sp. BvORR071]|uniref:hypothetical protein n=1 Tax=Haloferula sp. BvORR071 TaxID=1396141 RepID=UPI002240F4BF|nr:hypothetical protein [Haloferula sp. BvORR071]